MDFLQKLKNAKISFSVGNFNIKNSFSSSTAKSIAVENSSYVTEPDYIKHQRQLALHSPVKFIQKYLNKETISNALEKNSKIKEILKENKLDIEFNLENVNSIILSHLVPTSNMVKKIYTNMGHKQTEENYILLIEAALLHDIGKVFIPSEILNKKGKLNPKEREIIELHNKLSYEILITTDLNPNVAKLALEHHDYEKNLKRTEENQALTIADVYCALKEKRPYKKPKSDICAKAILYDMGTQGKLDTRYINYINSKPY